MAGEYDEHMLMNLGLHFPQPQVWIAQRSGMNPFRPEEKTK
jgi:hypothetical protein